jgi:hypothetical protein
VLVLKTEHGTWGIRIKPENTVMSQQAPECTGPRIDADGLVLIGSVELAGTRYGILDAEATWRGLRFEVAGWSGLMSGSDSSSLPPCGEEPARAGARAVDLLSNA